MVDSTGPEVLDSPLNYFSAWHMLKTCYSHFLCDVFLSHVPLQVKMNGPHMGLLIPHQHIPSFMQLLVFLSWTLCDMWRRENSRKQTRRGKKRIREIVGLIQLPIFQGALVLHLLSEQIHCLSCQRHRSMGTLHCMVAWHRVPHSDNVTAGTLGN